MRYTAENEVRSQDLQMSENVYLCDMRAVELKLSEILSNPEHYEHITGVVARNTSHPAEDLARGWSRAGAQEPSRSIWDAMYNYQCVAYKRLWDLEGEFFSIEDIKRRVDNRWAASRGEKVLVRLYEEELFSEDLEKLHEILDEDDYQALVDEILERFEETARYTIRYDERLGGWFVAERGLSAYGGDNLVEAVENACDDERFSDCKYIVAFYPARVYTDSDSDVRAGYVVAAEPDLMREVYIIERDC